ncbi:MAG: YCF48-related protein [Candidatus Falkowbacteria bacterium]
MLNKKTIFLVISIFLSSFLLTGCLNSGSNKQPVNDAGIFRSVNKGETWQQTVLIPTISGKPGSISQLSVNSLEMDPSDSNAIYFGSYGNGLFYTYDGGRGWQKAGVLGNGTISDLAVDPSSKCVIYASVNNALYKTTDCNRTWSQVYFDNDLGVKINAIAIDHEDSARVYIGLSNGDVIKSFDRGVSWQTLHRIADNIVDIVIDPNDARNVFIATSKKGIYRSRDNGASWHDLNEQLKEFKAHTNFKDLTTYKNEPGVLFLASYYGLLKSDDNGETWSEINLIPQEQKTGINTIAVNPENMNEIYYATNATFYRTLDGGINWAVKKLPSTKAGWKLLINPDNTSIIYLAVKALK